jgi:DNA repair exonuclease SbcCD nuclease subunit
MKILITSDLHSQKGIWVDICIEYLKYITNFYFKNGIDYIFFAGDIFEKSSKINHESFVPLFKQFMEMKENGIKMIFIKGNHDIYNMNNDSIIETFSPFGKVILNGYEQIEINGIDFHFLDYTKDKSLIPVKGDYLITHVDILGFAYDNNYKVQDMTCFHPDDFSGFKRVFSGHYHRHQTMKNIVYQGSPYQLGFGETGVEKGFVVLDTDTDKWYYNKYENAPKFLKIKIEDFDKVDVKNSFIQIEINQKIENYVKLRHLLYERGALEVTPVFKTEENNIQVFKEISFNFNGTIHDMVVGYLSDVVKVENIDNKKLIEYFEKISREIK